MESAATATALSLLDTVREIQPVVRAHAAEAEKQRRLPDAVVNAMRERGLYRMWRPKAYGGLEVDPLMAFRVFEEVSRIDSAAGWNLQLACGADVFGAWFPEQGLKEVFAHPDAIVAGSFFPARRAVPRGGRVSRYRTNVIRERRLPGAVVHRASAHLRR